MLTFIKSIAQRRSASHGRVPSIERYDMGDMICTDREIWYVVSISYKSNWWDNWWLLSLDLVGKHIFHFCYKDLLPICPLVRTYHRLVNGPKTAYKCTLNRPHPRALKVPKIWSHIEDIHQGTPNRPFLSIRMILSSVNRLSQSNNSRMYAFCKVTQRQTRTWKRPDGLCFPIPFLLSIETTNSCSRWLVIDAKSPPNDWQWLSAAFQDFGLDSNDL